MLTLLHHVMGGLKSFRPYYGEQPERIWLGVPGQSMGLTNSLAGVAYSIISEHQMKNHVLKVNREKVAEGRLEVFLWLITNAPQTYREAVRLTLEFEKKEAA